jgi:hypothetical protein
LPRAEPSGHFADRFELTSRIEPLCVRITYDMECGGTQSACASGAIVNERPTDALPLRTRIDKQGVELNRAVLTALERSKADNLLRVLRHEYTAGGDLSGGKLDRIRMSEERLPVARVS